eukprot:TRINITY_DN22934_c0_g1_i1.p1 TRINITY_DN22934_c0_g1~~TRINITY_DN22934_c0_g1_i1.p1  ORF type:complete len:528 (-),score=-1.04 TRINITY_DN22934_c0_g1_i1:274-1830(-)
MACSHKCLYVCMISCLLLASSYCQSFKEFCASAVDRRHCLTYVASKKAQSGKELTAYAVQTTIEELQKLSTWASQRTPGFDRSPELEDCAELFEWSLRHLNNSLAILQRSVLSQLEAENVMTWLSASLTNHATCIDRLNVNKQQPVPYSSLYNVSNHISSTLAILTATLETGLTTPMYGRRLREEQDNSGSLPAWMRGNDRRLMQSPPGALPVDAVVAQDGSGNFRTITEALNAAPSKSNGRHVIHVKAGIYEEKIRLNKRGIMLVGDGKYATIVRSSRAGATLMSIATFTISGDNFIARDIGFENAASLGAGQAIALLVGSDHSAFYRCSIKSYQDTLYAFAQRQFYRECDIYGTVDFIFGNAAAVFQSCNIFARKSKYGGYITAQGRTDPNQNTGFTIQNCKVTAAPGDSASTHSIFLGRPWQRYSRTVYMQSYLDSIIQNAGWSKWSGDFALRTLYYAEYMNIGPGAGTSGRVKWPGFHVLSSPLEANRFTVGEFIGGTSWLPDTGVTFVAGLRE